MTKLRKLKSKDLFRLTNILNKIGIQEIKKMLFSPETKKLINTAQKDDTQVAELGFSMIMDLSSLIITNLPKCEAEVYEFVSSLSGKSIKEVEDLDLTEFLDIITAIFKKQEFKDFFSRLFKFNK